MPRAGKQAQMMRADGYVTAAEIASATGRNLGTIHKEIEAKTIPGVRSGWGWYVDIHAFLKQVEKEKTYPEGTTVLEQLRKLKLVVSKPARKTVTHAAR